MVNFIMSSKKFIYYFKDFIYRVERAVDSLCNGNGVILLDNKDRENEGDIIFSAEKMNIEQMALTIRHGSGIVCLCLTEERRYQLDLPMMVKDNTSIYGTSFTVTIEAAHGVSTGVSAKDRLTTIRAAIADNAQPSDLHRPGHVFPLVSSIEGLYSRKGHTEASIALVKLANLKPFSVLCELINDDGSMSKLPELIILSDKYSMPLLTIDDLYLYYNFHDISFV
ncbi:3,4-dihydroxy-2-butanone-4-phosphate synthase [Candidatus Purcelliella pentastirinorum]|nr:3,4-dihydroxy-2-butanone-4-phosphate synthase [Candidatus Purcelliella pentastirinorum]WDI78760.1 3,4-dihydroxy-2-butanone-4-phosphate synthase [Candidatus Purcelliella pentastirinorum]